MEYDRLIWKSNATKETKEKNQKISTFWGRNNWFSMDFNWSLNDIDRFGQYAVQCYTFTSKRFHRNVSRMCTFDIRKEKKSFSNSIVFDYGYTKWEMKPKRLKYCITAEQWTLNTSLRFSIAPNANPYKSIIEEMEKRNDVSKCIQVQFWIVFFFLNIVNKSWITRVKSTWKLVSILKFVSRLKSFFLFVLRLFCFVFCSLSHHLLLVAITGDKEW